MDKKNKNIEREVLEQLTRESRASLRMNKIMLNIYQTERLREILFFAKSKSRWYGEKLKNVEIDKITTENMSQYVPITNKKEFTENWDAFCTDAKLSKNQIDVFLKEINKSGNREEWNLYKGKYHVISSSGSSGRPGIYVYTKEEWLRQCAQYSRFVSSNFDKLRIANLTVKSLLFASPRCSKTIMQGRRDYDLDEEYFRDPDTINQRLTELNPEVLITLPSILERLIKEKEQGNLDINPSFIKVSAEPLNKHLKENTIRIFDNPVINNYFAGSEGFSAFTCKADNQRMHLSEDYCTYETIGSKLTITNLWLKTTPLIRYQLDDKVEIKDEGRCESCGCSFRTIMEPQGRASEKFIYENNKIVTALEMVDKMNYYPCISEYQIQQTKKGIIINLAGDNSTDDNRIKQSMMQILKQKKISEATVEIFHVDHIERSGSGKLKQFIKLDEL
ncbi:hypothetical protein [Synechococcus sp. MU1625]|uniref:hypothetical protein n=1 Tax=Synechococcus sp. MU1625 TaxID=2508347 RepID=UPI001CF87BFC|nr:hypothetical protein [Synechococcus sp. MU1625]MCB4398421.1 hypothetical protein [Synechococcus sp. MU1625]